MSNRKQVIGLDKQTSRPLSSYTQPERALLKQALAHETHRLESVAETLALIGLMTLKKVLSGNEMVAVKGDAEYQFGEGVKAHGTVGAHCLPGKINFNNTHLHIMAEWRPDVIKQRGMKPIPLSSKLRNLFARVDVFDSSINNADSWSEKMSGERGLKFHLGKSVQRLMKDISFQKPSTIRSLGKLVEDSFEHYKFGARYIYEERLDSLTNPSSYAKPGKNDATRRFIVECYWDVLRDTSFVPDAITTLGFRDLIRDVLAEGPLMISTGTSAFQP